MATENERKPVGVTTALALACASILGASTPDRSLADSPRRLERIRVAPDGGGFVGARSGIPFQVWGLNYDHDTAGRLLEDYWADEWPRVEGDFREMADLGATVVRIHLQLGRFLVGPHMPDLDALDRLTRLLRLAEATGLRLDLTGLGCYHRTAVPAWYDPLPEAERWAAQATFWRAVARTCAGHPAVFCYDLMNEPVVPGPGRSETDWLPGTPLGGKHFVQRITLDLAGRSRHGVAAAWVARMAGAVRAADPDSLVTVGTIPWAYAFSPSADTPPLFHSGEAGRHLDFVSVHFYPRAGEVDKALQALAVYQVGKPLVVEEFFPLRCSRAEAAAFIDRAQSMACGWMGFYWGTPVAELRQRKGDIAAAMLAGWLDEFVARSPRRPSAPKPLSSR